MTFQVKPASSPWSKAYKEAVASELLTTIKQKAVLESRLQAVESQLAGLQARRTGTSFDDVHQVVNEWIGPVLKRELKRAIKFVNQPVLPVIKPITD